MIRQIVERFGENETVQHRLRGHSGKIGTSMTSSKINIIKTDITQNPKQLKMQLSMIYQIFQCIELQNYIDLHPNPIKKKRQLHCCHKQDMVDFTHGYFPRCFGHWIESGVNGYHGNRKSYFKKYDIPSKT